MSPRTTPCRLAVVLSHPTQYYSPWFRWLAREPALGLRVFYLWDFGVTPTRDPLFQQAFRWDVDLLSGYEHEFVPNVSRDPGTHWRGGLDNPQLGRRLAAWRPDAVLLFGYAYRSNLRLIAWARIHGVPLIFRGDSHLLGRTRPPLLTRVALRLLYRQFAAITYVGEANRRYFAALGVPDSRLWFSPHAVNHAWFDPSLPAVQPAARALRTQLGIAPATRVLLYAGKLIPAKQPRELLEAFIALALPGTALLFVGDGPERSGLVTLAAQAPAGTVHFLPFANQSEMPVRYATADIFALPSRGLYETWGLAVNEAMHLGLPALVSDRVGCQQDLVTDGVTGWVFRAEDPAHLRIKLQQALTTDLARMRAAVRERISRYTYAEATAGLLQALRQLGLAPSPP
jgi:glycosyltransferase involved in cell wall biosynthesis